MIYDMGRVLQALANLRTAADIGPSTMKGLIGGPITKKPSHRAIFTGVAGQAAPDNN